ncbi:MAG: MerC domain-containing protein [Pirellulaceae bacterium]|nr:MerC domain-containing protein [Pirellulaceae bacterium]
MSSVTETPGQRLGTDWLGVICSLGCAIHCAAMPILLTALPSLTAVQWLADPLFHQVVAVVCAVIVTLAILPGWRKHRSRAVAGLASTGIGFLFVAAFILPDQCCLTDHTSVSVEPAAVHSLVADNEGRIPGQATQRHQLASFTMSPSVSTSVSPTMKPVTSQVEGSVGEGRDLGCAEDDCVFCRPRHDHATTYSRSLFTSAALQQHMGTAVAAWLINGQPWLSPLGGVMLIFGHLLNIRLQVCRCRLV